MGPARGPGLQADQIGITSEQFAALDDRLVYYLGGKIASVGNTRLRATQALLIHTTSKNNIRVLAVRGTRALSSVGRSVASTATIEPRWYPLVNWCVS